MPITALIVANLTTTAPYADSFVVEVYSDLALTTLVGHDSCAAVASTGGGFVQSTALVVHGLTYGATYYARAGVVAPVTGVVTWSATDTIVMGTHTAPSGVTYTTTLTATTSGISVSTTPASVPTNILNYEAVWVTDASTPAATVAPNWTGNVNGAGALLFFAGAAPASVVHIFIRSVNTSGQTQAWTSLGSATVLTPTSGTVTGISGDVTAVGSGNVTVTVTKINGTSLAGLGTGLLKNTTGTGVPSIATAADIDPLLRTAIQFVVTGGAVASPSALTPPYQRNGVTFVPTVCEIYVQASDGSTGLAFDITKNGTSIFSATPTLAAGISAGITSSGTLVSSLSLSYNDVFALNITSGTSSWKFTLTVR